LASTREDFASHVWAAATRSAAEEQTAMSENDPVKKAIELLKRIKHQSVDIEGEGHKYKSERLVRLSHEIDLDCTDALNALYSVVK
jgi:hypothetical protein